MKVGMARAAFLGSDMMERMVNVGICGRGPAQDVPFDLILWYIAKNSYFFGIGTIRDVELTYIFRPIFLFIRCIEDRSQYYNIKVLYTSVFKCFYHVIELCFVPCFGAEFEKMFILKVYIYLP